MRAPAEHPGQRAGTAGTALGTAAPAETRKTGARSNPQQRPGGAETRSASKQPHAREPAGSLLPTPRAQASPRGWSGCRPGGTAGRRRRQKPAGPAQGHTAAPTPRPPGRSSPGRPQRGWGPQLLIPQAASQLLTWKGPGPALGEARASPRAQAGPDPRGSPTAAGAAGRGVLGPRSRGAPGSPHRRSRSGLHPEGARTGARSTGLCAPAASTSRRGGSSPLPTCGRPSSSDAHAPGPRPRLPAGQPPARASSPAAPPPRPGGAPSGLPQSPGLAPEGALGATAVRSRDRFCSTKAWLAPSAGLSRRQGRGGSRTTSPQGTGTEQIFRRRGGPDV